jgi:hypothetical protein
MQEANSDIRLEAQVTTYQLQGPLDRKAEEQGKRTLLQVSCFDLMLVRHVRSSRKREQEQQ